MMLLGLSALLCAFDLYHYACKKVENPDEDSEWPKSRWIFVDILMAALLQFIFWCAIASLSDFYDANIIAAYGALGTFLCS